MLYLASGNSSHSKPENLAVVLSSKTFKMSEYQRDPKWQFEHVQDLLDSLIDIGKENDKTKWAIGYGQIILFKNAQEDVTYIVDGQQRLTRISLCILALLDIINNDLNLLKKDFFDIESNVDNFEDLKNLIINKRNTSKINLKTNTPIQEEMNAIFTQKLFSLNESFDEKLKNYKIMEKTKLVLQNKNNSSVTSFKRVAENYFKIYNYFNNAIEKLLEDKSKVEKVNFLSKFYDNILYVFRENFKFSVQYFTDAHEANSAFVSVNMNSIPLTTSENIMGKLYTIPHKLNKENAEKALMLIQEFDSLNNGNPENFFKCSSSLINGRMPEKNFYKIFTEYFLTKQEINNYINSGKSESEIQYFDLLLKAELNHIYNDSFIPEKANYLKNKQLIKLLNLFNSNNTGKLIGSTMFRTIVLAVLYKIKKEDLFYNENYLIELLKFIAKMSFLNIFTDKNEFNNNVTYDLLINFAHEIWIGNKVYVSDILEKCQKDDLQRYKKSFDYNSILQNMKTKQLKSEKHTTSVSFLYQFLTFLNSKNTTVDKYVHLDHFVPQKYVSSQYLGKEFLIDKIYNLVNLHLINGNDNSKAQNKHHEIKFNDYYLLNDDLFSTKVFNELYKKHNKITTQKDLELLEQEYCEIILEQLKFY